MHHLAEWLSLFLHAGRTKRQQRANKQPYCSACLTATPGSHFGLLSYRVCSASWLSTPPADQLVERLDRHIWVTKLWLCANWGPSQLCVQEAAAQDGRCYQCVSKLSHPSDTCHQRSLPPFSLPLSPHPSHCQALVRCTSPLALWSGLPSNNFISFPPLSRWPAPPLTIDCCFFFPERGGRKAQCCVGRVENPAAADIVLDTGQWYWWLQRGCLEQRSHTENLGWRNKLNFIFFYKENRQLLLKSFCSISTPERAALLIPWE